MALAASTADAEAEDASPEGERERAYAFGTVLNFGAGGNADRYKDSGWYTAEEDFSWTGKAPGIIALRVPATGGALDLHAKLGGMIKPGTLPVQPTEVYANGEKIAEWQVAYPADFYAQVPSEIAGAGGRLEIQLRPLKPVAPKAINAGADVRILGLRCESMVITPQRSELPEASPSPTPHRGPTPVEQPRR
jgi:hypothetical protein